MFRKVEKWKVFSQCFLQSEHLSANCNYRVTAWTLTNAKSKWMQRKRYRKVLIITTFSIKSLATLFFFEICKICCILKGVDKYKRILIKFEVKINLPRFELKNLQKLHLGPTLHQATLIQFYIAAKILDILLLIRILY